MLHFDTIKARLPDKQRLNVVITGSTKGIGKALAAKYYQNGANVIINSRNTYNVIATHHELYSNENENLIYGVAADISNAEDVKFMLNCITTKMSTIDLWINNAGTCTYKKQPFLEFDETDIQTIVSTNMLGVMYCCKYVIPVMETQPNGGHIINVIGAGSNGHNTNGYSVYGSTKSGIMQFTKTLAEETKNSKVGIHILSPGMVKTDLIMSNVENEPKLKEVIDMMCEQPNVVSEHIIKKIKNDIIVPNAKHKTLHVFNPCNIVYKVIFHHLRKIFRIH